METNYTDESTVTLPIKVESSEENKKIKMLIGEIIKTPVNDSWEIIDSKPDADLYLVHYGSDANMNIYGHIRGIIVDIKKRMIVCDAYKYTPVVKCDELKADSDGRIQFRDTLGKRYVGNVNTIKIFPGFEVVTIRAFLHNGIVYYPTYRKINIWNSGSRWGDSIEFDKMALELKIPPKEVLFPRKEMLYSSYTHIFMLVHKGILNATKADIKDGYIVYGGTKDVWQPDVETLEKIGVDLDFLDMSPVNLDLTNDLDEAKNTLKLFKPDNFTLEQANQFLKYGYYSSKCVNQSDIRLNTGEFVIVYTNNSSDPFKNVLRIESSSYRWRSLIKNDHPNIKYRYFQLQNMVRMDTSTVDGMAEFRFNFPKMSKFSVQSIIKKVQTGYIHFWPPCVDITDQIFSDEDKKYNIWACLLMSVPLHKQKYVVDLYYQLEITKKETVEMLYKIYLNENPDRESDDSECDDSRSRAMDIIKLGKGHALRNLNTNFSSLITSKDNISTLNERVKYNLEYLINNESGESLYRVYKHCLNILSA